MTAREQRRNRCRWIGPGVALLLAVGMGGCGNVTAGGFTDADVYMSGDTDGGGSSGAAVSPERPAEEGPAAAGGPSATGPSATVVGAQLEGEVQATLSLYLLREGDAPFELTPAGGISTTVDLAGAQEPRVVSATIPAVDYSGVRMVFTEVTAVVTGGLEIGGVPFTDSVSVTLGGPELTVDRVVSLPTDEQTGLSLVVDLNSATWLDQLDPLAGTVAAADFADAVGILVR